MYLLSKEVDIYTVIFTLFVIGYIVFNLLLRGYKKQIEAQESEPKRYWVEKVIKGNMEEVYQLKSNYPYVMSNSEFYTLKETMDEIKHRKEKDLFKVEISREVVWTEDIQKVDLSKSTVPPPPPDDRYMNRKPKDIGYVHPNSTVTSTKS
jgi:hypothetical protein